MISVKVPEDALPFGDIFPQTGELLKADGTTTIDIENVHQHLDRIKIKFGPISIDEGILQLGDAQRTGIISIYCSKPLPQLGVGSGGGSRLILIRSTMMSLRVGMMVVTSGASI